MMMGLALLILLVCCIPVEVTFQMQAADRLAFRATVLWGFGLIRKELGATRKAAEKKRQDNARPKPQKRDIGGAAFIRILKSKTLLSQLRRLVIDTLRCLRLKAFNADLRLGLDDPADTGLLFALIGPAVLGLHAIWPHPIRIAPSFEEEAVLEGYAHGTVRAQPIQLIAPIIRFMFSPPTFSLLEVMISDLWKRQR